MASVKRKAQADEEPNKRVKARSRPASDRLSHLQPSAQATIRRPPQNSILQKGDRAFPRGGAGILLPIEERQIKAQADHDALFEQQRGDEDYGPTQNEIFAHGQASKTNKEGRKRNKSTTNSPHKSASISILSLGYRILVPGSLVLGRVSGITSKDIAIALPNNLTGYVPLTSVSEILTTRLMTSSTQSIGSTSDCRDEGIDPLKLFFVGQWLRALVVTEGEDSSNAKHGRHILMTLDPKHVNPGLCADQFPIYCTVQAAVYSVEDHGIIMDIGLADASMRGFISKKELGSTWNISTLVPGQVMLCLVTGRGANGKVLKLCPDTARFSAFSNATNQVVPDEATSVEVFLPGTAANIIITGVSPAGIVGKLLGVLDVTADFVHTHSRSVAEVERPKLKIGNKMTVRILFSLLSEDGSRRVGISCLPTLLSLSPPLQRLPANASAKQRAQAFHLENRLSSHTIPNAVVKEVKPDRGLFVDLGLCQDTPVVGFVHISQVSDQHLEFLPNDTGAHRLGSQHEVRVTNFNPIDNLYYSCMKTSILSQPCVSLDDLAVGQLMTGTIEKLVLGGRSGLVGAIVRLSHDLTGLVPEMHLSDIHLTDPERKFRNGVQVRCRVLSIDQDKRQVRLTLKKSLLGLSDDQEIWHDYRDLRPGMHTRGTVINIVSTGAVIQFFSNVRAWLPVAEMSDSFVTNPNDYLRSGQTIEVTIISVDSNSEEMKVSCRDHSALDEVQQETWSTISGGDIVTGTVSAKSEEKVIVDLTNGLRGTIEVGHLTDGGSVKHSKVLRRIHVGQILSDVLVLGKIERGRTIRLTLKTSLIAASKEGSFPTTFEDLKKGSKVHGFVRNVNPGGIYAEFANGLVGLLPTSLMSAELAPDGESTFSNNQTIHAWIVKIDPATKRFVLSMRTPEHEEISLDSTLAPQQQLSPPREPREARMGKVSVEQASATIGVVFEATIISVKSTQLNMRLANGLQGRIDISEIFDSWEDIRDSIAPLRSFRSGSVLDVKVLGLHDSRNHRFLPISHRQSQNMVLELTAKQSRIRDGDDSLLTLDSVVVGRSYAAFVNNHNDDCIWVSLSPGVRGRIALIDLVAETGSHSGFEAHYPVGAAIRVVVKKVDLSTRRLDLATSDDTRNGKVKMEDFASGALVPARVTKITQNQVHVQLADSVAAPIPLVELSDDYDDINMARFSKNDIIQVSVVYNDEVNKRLYLSLRPSQTLSSALPVKDRQLKSAIQLGVDEIIRGFVKHIGDNGVFVSLGAQLDGFVRIRDLTDHYVKDWKNVVRVDQLVKGRVLKIDSDANHVLLSLKASHVDPNYQQPLTFDRLEIGQIVRGVVRKVEDFGAFIDIENTVPRLSGLCHRSEVAAKRVEDVRTLFSPGDVVKGIILGLDRTGKKISLGLKASYFVDEEKDAELNQADEEGKGGLARDESVAQDMVGSEGDDLAATYTNLRGFEHADHADENVTIKNDETRSLEQTAGLHTNGFDWEGLIAARLVHPPGSIDASVDWEAVPEKRKQRTEPLKEKLTGAVGSGNGHSASDFERQLLGRPNDSKLWVQYMAFQLELGEIEEARRLAERALKTIHLRDSDEKINVWTAWLNLEVEFGSPETVESILQRACQTQDAITMHERLASIYIESGRNSHAKETFDKMASNKAFRASPDLWYNYGLFLMNTMENPTEAHTLLPRALQSVPNTEQRALTAKFACLEFRSSQGDPERGRTMFESLLSQWPKWVSGWDMWIDSEYGQVTRSGSAKSRQEALERTRSLYKRIASHAMKKRRAKFFFKRWLQFETLEGGDDNVNHVRAVAGDFVDHD